MDVDVAATVNVQAPSAVFRSMAPAGAPIRPHRTPAAQGASG